MIDGLIRSVLHKDGKSPSGETLVIAAHDQQMRLWMIRQGLKFFPKQDDVREARRKKIQEVINYNRMDLYYDGIVTMFLCRGSVLWYLRPTGTEAYEIHWFQGGDVQDSETEYKAYYKPGGRILDQVIIRYSYDDYSTYAGSSVYLNQGNRKKWIRLKITEEWIIEEKFLQQPSLLPDGVSLGLASFMGGGPIEPASIQKNTLGFIPCTESPNYPMRPGDSGKGEFDWLQTAIEAENDMRSAMVDNVFTFSSPNLVTSRPAAQIMEDLHGDQMGDKGRLSWSSQQGFGTSRHSSARFDDPWVRGNRYGNGSGLGSGGNNRRKIAAVIGNVSDQERFGYIFPDPINGDQWRFAQEYREGIHECLGGIDPLGVKSGMTFAETKSLFGKVAATASKKCKSLWTYGLAKLLEMVLFIEEKMFLDSYRYYLLTASPLAKKLQKEWQGVQLEGVTLEQFIPNEMVLQDYSVTLQIPPGVTGLAPYGEREIDWKWAGPVFEATARDELDQSIVIRNRQELGVGSLEAMQMSYPDKDPSELKSMLTGVPFRFISSVSSSIGTLLQLQQQLMSIPDPINPALPLAARPELDLTPLIQQQIMTLGKECAYGQEFVSESPIDSPTYQPLPPVNQSDNPNLLSPVNPDSSSLNPSLGNEPASISNGSGSYSASLPNSGIGGYGSTGPSSFDPSVQRNSISTNTSPAYSPALRSFQPYTLNPESLSRLYSGQQPGSIGASGSGVSEWQRSIPLPGGSVISSGNASPSSLYQSNAGLPTGLPTGIPYDILSTPSLYTQLLNQQQSSPNPERDGKRPGKRRGSARGGRKK